MLAYHISERGSAPVLRELSLEAPAADQIRVRIHACALNFADLLMIKDTYQDTPDAPFTLGLEVSGEVLEVGTGVRDFASGDRVAVYSGQGGLAEMGNFEARRAVKIPDHVSYRAAAAFPIASSYSL